VLRFAMIALRKNRRRSERASWDNCACEIDCGATV
jgi:hypothetical protein